MIVNWRAAEFLILDFGNPRPVAMALLPGHLILGYHTITDRTFNLDIQLYPAASFDGRWHPLGGFGTDLCIDPSEIASLPVPIALGPLSRAVRLCITKNPLRDYTLMVECHSDFPAPITLSLFLLTLRPSPEPMLSTLPQASLKYISRHAFLKSGRTSAAGYSMAWNADYSRVLVYPPDEERGVRYESDAMFAPVMTYTPHLHGPEIQSRELPIEDVDDVTKVFLSDSGAVIARYDGRVVVSYYV
ncbi:hypothetical protein C8R43DRAFT_1006226 [Mycena crocata]|nr:hypothetical protein C8R43DRAFT_1006226 [Mycena crocata]